MKTQYIKKNNAGIFYYSDKTMTKPHREDGPAFEWAGGSKAWYLNGQPHREDGPAYEFANGDKAWYLNGKSLAEEEWEKRIMKKKTININGKAFTIEELNNLIASVK